MPKLGNKILFACGCVALAAVALVVMQSQKYYVKRFVKDHKFLYQPLKKVIDWKHAITTSWGDNRQGDSKTLESSLPKTDPWALRLDASQPGLPFARFWGNVGYESFKSGTLASENRQFFALMQEANENRPNTFRYVRAHNLYSNGVSPWGEGCEIYQTDGNGRPSYNWEIMDQVFDAILAHGLRPIVEFGFMPDALASDPARRQKWSKANISPPNDYRRWRDLVQATVAHLVERYGENEIRQWYFEVWNEPDLGYLFWIEDPDHRPWGDLDEYFKLYDYTVDGAKRAFPNIQIGGPVSAGLGIGEFMEHAYLRKNYVSGETGSPVDFVSSHAYGKIHLLEGGKKKKNIVDGIRLKIDRALQHDHKMVRREMQNMPFLLTETGPSTNNAPYYNTRYVAAWWSKLVDAMFYLGEKWGAAYQPEELVLWTSEPVVKNFSTGWGLATRLKTGQGWKVFKRPAFNIFEMLGSLGNERLAVGGSNFGDPLRAFATRQEDGSVQILVYHIDEWDTDNASPDSQQVNLVVENLPFSDFSVQCYMIDESHSNSFTVWKSMGKPEILDPKQAELLQKRDDLEMYEPVAFEQSPGRDFKKDFKLQSNSVALFILSKGRLVTLKGGTVDVQ